MSSRKPAVTVPFDFPPPSCQVTFNQFVELWGESNDDGIHFRNYKDPKRMFLNTDLSWANMGG